MKFSAFPVVIMVALLASGSAQAFPFGKKDDGATAEKTASPDGIYLSDRFRGVDQNHDGKVSEEEFLAADKKQFSTLDQDKDGIVSPDEYDFPQGIKPEQKAEMRKQLEQRETQMKKMRADQEKRMQEDRKRREAGGQNSGKPPIIPTPAPADKTAPVVKTETPTTTPAPAAAKAVTYSSANAAAATSPLGFSSAAAKAAAFTSSSGAVAPVKTTPAKKL